MKRVLFINPRLATGGAERQIVTVATLLKRKGYDVEFLCYSYGDFFEEQLLKEGVPVYWKQHNYIVRLLSCTWFIQRRKYDIVISFLPTPCFINCFSAMLRKKWKVITGERSSIVKKPKSTFEKFSHWLNRYSDAIVCNSLNAQNLWEVNFPHLKDKMRTIYNAVLISCNNNITYIPKINGKLHICVAARFSDVKNSVGLVKSIMLMTKEERGLFVVDWYGMQKVNLTDTSVFDKTLRLVNVNNLHDCIRFHEETNDIADRMMESDCVALFSKYEGFPNTICEGMILGKPVILTQVSDYKTIVGDNENGFLCEWDNPLSIKNAILSMARKTISELKEMGKISSNKASRLFSLETIQNKWIELIEE